MEEKVELPQLGESVTEGTVVRWFKKVGEQVTEHEPLYEVSTDKVDSEVPAPLSGVLASIVQEGTTVAVGEQVATIHTSECSEPVDSNKPPVAKAHNMAPEIAEHNTVSPLVAPQVAVMGGESGAYSSPLVKKQARDAGIDSRVLVGTGTKGRVTMQDLQAHASAATIYSVGEVAGGLVKNETGAKRADVFEPFNNIQKRTGAHMVQSLSAAPHAITAVEVLFDNVDRTRLAQKDNFKRTTGRSLTYLPFISRAVLDTLASYPRLNAVVEDTGLRLVGDVHLSIAVDLNFQGLVAPVIRHANDLRLAALGRRIGEQADKARYGKLEVDDLVGGTFTITNSGSYGTHMVIPIINQPQVAILSTDGVSRKPVVVAGVGGEELLTIRSVGMLTMSWDHRAIDGAYAAAFLRDIKKTLETRNWDNEI